MIFDNQYVELSVCRRVLASLCASGHPCEREEERREIESINERDMGGILLARYVHSY